MTVVVIDASALVEYLRWSPAGRSVAGRIAPPDVTLQMPHSCAIEVASAFRGLVLGHKMAAAVAGGVLQDVDRFPAIRHPIDPLLPRIWSLRHNLTAYDAAYVALAEALDAVLLTADAKFDTATVTQLIDVEVIS